MTLATLVQVADYLETLMNTVKTTYGINNVYYGDQNKLAGARCVCIEPDTKTNSDYKGAFRMVTPEYSVFVIVYELRILDPQFNRKEADAVAESLEAEIHKDASMGGLVVDSHVALVESGYRIIDTTLARVTRLNVRATGRGILGV